MLPLAGAIQHNHEQSGNHNNFPNIYTIWILLCHIIGFLHHFLYGIFFLPFIIYFVKSFIYFFSCFPFKSTFYYTLFLTLTLLHFAEPLTGWLVEHRETFISEILNSFFFLVVCFYFLLISHEWRWKKIILYNTHTILSSRWLALRLSNLLSQQLQKTHTYSLTHWQRDVFTQLHTYIHTYLAENRIESRISWLVSFLLLLFSFYFYISYSPSIGFL